LGREILTALREAGKDLDNLTRSDLKAIDEFHTRGLKATMELAELAKVKPGMKIVDLGCGIGGPARALADEYDCKVTGIDIIDEYCQAASMLTKRVKLNDRVKFLTADMMQPIFPDSAFDMAWSQHTIMNIKDKSKLLDLIHSMLKPGGRYAFYEICSGSREPVYFPVPWASDPSISFLVSSNEFRESIFRSGFEEAVWQDTTEESLMWFRKIIKKAKVRATEAAPFPGLKLVMGKKIGTKLENMVRNLEEDRIRIVQGVFEKLSM